MFADSLLESAVHRPTRRRSLSLLTSLTLEALVVAVLVAIPLVHPDMLSAAPPRIVVPIPIEDFATQPGPVHHGGGGGSPHALPSPLPVLHPSGRTIFIGSARSSHTDESAPFCATCPIGPDVGPSTGPIITNAQPIIPLPPPHHAPVIVSHFDPGTIVHQVLPVYPDLARKAHIQGDVRLQAVITREGTIAELSVISGHPMLAPAALDAVRQWRFRPYMLNGQAVPVETTITVNFRLGADGGAL